MNKRYVIRLDAEERQRLERLVKVGKVAGYKIRHAHMLLMADVAGPAMTDEQIEIMRDPKRAPTAKLPRIEDAVKSGGFLTGSPEEIIEHLMKLEIAYPGLDRISISLSVGVPEAVALEQLERFAKEVMPAFKNRKVEVKTPELAK